jgi:lactoylglutathione lyase
MQFCWVTVNVKDMETSLAFFRDIVGLPVKRRMNPMPGTEIVFLGNGDAEVELIKNDKNDNPQFGKDISLGFTVDSVEKKIEFLKSKNIKVHAGPFQPGPMVKFFFVLDPNGLQIQFVENIRR